MQVLFPWMFRMMIIALLLLTFLYYRRQKSLLSGTIFTGLIIMCIGVIIDYGAYTLLFSEKQTQLEWYKVTKAGKYILSLGCLVAVSGAWANVVMKEKSRRERPNNH